MNNHSIKPGTKISLKAFDTDAPKGNSKEESEPKLKALSNQLEALQETLYAEHEHKVLLIFQGMDTSGKDGVIRNVFQEVNPAHIRIVSFKVPTQEEADHDFLWRVHKQVPCKGELVIFNRSHYEAVLPVRVHKLEPEKVWRQHYAQINDFERLLAEEGTLILKFFLHIDKDEQKKRLQERMKDVQKQWKFNPGDLEERKFWDDYQIAYEEAISKTNTEYAPWHIIPANQKWYRNLLVSEIIVEALEGLKMEFPKKSFDEKLMKM